jgi:Ca-activated chloride channel family protein
MTIEHEDQLHEKLCAYVLGEASADERAEVERELAKSSALRAQKVELEATIGFVKNAMAGSETLSAEATQQVLSAVKMPKARPWYSFAPVKIAAGIAALLGGYALYHVIERRERENPMPLAYELFGDPADAVAQADTRRPLGIESEKKRESAALDGLGYTGAEAKDQKLDAGLADGTKANEIASVGEQPASEDFTGVRIGPIKSESLNFENKSRDLLSASPAESEDARVAQLTKERQEWVNSSSSNTFGETAIGVGAGGQRASSAPAARTVSPLARHGGPTSGGPSGPSTPARPGPVATGGTSRSQSDSLPPAAPSVGLERPEQLHNVGYAGESDESSAEYTGLITGSDDFFLGRGAAKRLEGLGYTGADDSSERWRALTPEQQQHYIDRECKRIFQRCYRRPNERPRDMFFRFWGDNPFELAAIDPQSTFSVDVDTASYALARRYLNEGTLPEKAQIRTEEFLNYFKADVPAPTESTFAIHTDLTPSRFSSDTSRSMLRVVIRGREVTKQQRKPLALTFVVDTSGSMSEQNRLEMVKHAMRLLVGELDANDSVAIVKFSSDAILVLPMTSAKNRGLIESAIHPLQPENSTNAEAGLRMGYEAAFVGLNPNATNRVVFLSDGVANMGQTDQDRISESVKLARDQGIYLNTIGVGMNNHNDTLLEQLADKGDGMCNYIDTPAEAKRVLVDNFTGAFQPIARDVKIQVEFDPAQVYRYRLLGYENRAIADKDFRNDAIDAGEIGAGHQVTALYEIERSNQAAEKPLATVRLRWKAPRAAGSDAAKAIARAETKVVEQGDSKDLEVVKALEGLGYFGDDGAKEVAQPVLASQATGFEGAGAGYRRAVIVAQFAELLRRSTHARGDSLDDLIAEAQKLEREANDADFSELVGLMQKSRALIVQNLPACDELCQAIDVIRRNQILRAEHESLSTERDAKLLEELEKQNADLEQKIRELLRRRLAEKAK